MNEIIFWLTGYDEKTLQKHLDDKTNFEDFFNQANIHPNASKITGVICGYRVEDIEEKLIEKNKHCHSERSAAE